MHPSARVQTLRHLVLPPMLMMIALIPWAQAQTQVTPTEQAVAQIEVKAIPHPLSWINRQKDYRVLSDDSLSITAPKGTDLYNDNETGTVAGNAPMLTFPPDDAFVLTAQVTPDFKQEFDAGFLVVYVDQARWAKLLLEKSHYGQLSVGSSVTNTYSDDSVNADVPGKEAYLRITKSKDVFTFYYSVDGQKWQYIRYFKFPSKGGLRVGFASQSPSGEQCATVFSKIIYVPKAPSDFWTGEPAREVTKTTEEK